MNYSDDTLKKVKQFGFLQYGLDKIIDIINPSHREQFAADMLNGEEPLCVMYQSGLNSGKFNLDVAEFKLKSAEAEKAQTEVKQGKHLNAMINDFCGIEDDN